VWCELAGGAARLPGAAPRRAFMAVGLALALVIAATAGWESGVLVPQLNWGVWNVTQSSPPSDTVSVDVEITNASLATLTVLNVGRSGPGLDLIGTQGPLPARLAPDASVRVILTYRITDCARVPTGPGPVAVRIDQYGETRTAYPRSLFEPDYPWPQWVTSPWCHSGR
jgi:hypothetical protein